MVVTLQKVMVKDPPGQRVRRFENPQILDDLIRWTGTTGPDEGIFFLEIADENLNRVLLAVSLIQSMSCR